MACYKNFIIIKCAFYPAEHFNNLKIIHQNSQISSNKLDDLSQLSPNIFIVSEHCFSKINSIFFKINDNFNLASFFFQRTSFKGGGVAIFIPKQLKFQTIKIN